MGMQYDVKSYYLAVGDSPASMGTGRVRIKGMYFESGASAGTVEIKDGGSGGATRLKVGTPAATTAGNGTVFIPAEGILCDDSPYVVLTNTASVTIIYG